MPRGPMQSAPPWCCARNFVRSPLTNQIAAAGATAMSRLGRRRLAVGQSGTGGQNFPRSGIEALSLLVEEARRDDASRKTLPQMLEGHGLASAGGTVLDQAQRDRPAKMEAHVAAGEIAQDAFLAAA